MVSAPLTPSQRVRPPKQERSQETLGRIFAAARSVLETKSFDEATLSEIVEREQRDALRAAIAELPDRYRVPLTLRYYADMSYEEISTALGISHGQVATLLFRSKRRLRGVVRA